MVSCKNLKKARIAETENHENGGLDSTLILHNIAAREANHK